MQYIHDLKPLSPHEFGLLGIEHLAYVKRIVVEDVVAFAVHAADGSEIATVLDREAACALVRRHDMEPLSVH
ncbi:MAG: DUF1150 family protein [Thiohalocapsa sp.]